MEDKLICPICNNKYKLLGRHMKLTHKLSNEMIQQQYPGLKLMVDSERERITSQLTESREKNWQNPEYKEKMRDAAKRNMQAIHDDPEKVKKSQEKAYESRMKHASDDPDWWYSVRSTAAKHCWQNQSRIDAHHNLLVELWKDPEYRKNQTNRFIDMLNDIWSDPERAKECFYGYHTYKSVEYSSKNNGVLYFRSSWEKVLASFMDANNIDWSYESLSIKFCYENKNHHYIPDFYLKDYNLILEVKPNKFIDDYVIAKLNASEDAGYKIKLITEDHLWLSDSDLINYITK